MKRIFQVITLVILIFVGLTSCKKYTDYSNVPFVEKSPAPWEDPGSKPN